MNQRIFHILIAVSTLRCMLVHCLAQSTGVGHPPPSDTFHAIPIQSYAVIDMSGSTTTNDVERVALDDNNNVAFEYHDAGSDVWHAYSWQNGTAHSSANVTSTIDVGSDQTNYYFVTALDAAGQLWGDMGIAYDGEAYTSVGQAFVATGAATPSPISPPSLSSDYYFFWGPHIDAVNGTDYIGILDIGSAGDSIFSVYYSYHAGIYTLFSSTPVNWPGSNQVTFYTQGTPGPWFELSGSNNAIGMGLSLWNGSQLTQMSATSPSSAHTAGVNNQGQALIQDNDADGNLLGSLWQNGVRTNIKDLLPAAYKNQIDAIIPRLISNRLPTSGTAVQPVVNIVFEAADLIVPDNNVWSGGTFLLRQLSDGTTDLQEIKIPDNADVRFKTSFINGFYGNGIDGVSMNANGLIVSLSTDLSSSTSTWKAVLLLPMELKKAWETKNKANQVWNPTKKDDPVTNGQQPNSVQQIDGVPRNKIYMVTDPSDDKYKVTLDVDIPDTFRTKFVAAAYVGDTKVPDSDKAFPASGTVDMEFDHASTSKNNEDFAIRIGYDANGNGKLDQNEQTKFQLYTHSDKKDMDELMVRGSNQAAYDNARNGSLGIDRIIDGTYDGTTSFALPHAKRFLQIFRDRSSDNLPTDKQPTSTDGIDFNALSGLFCEWLTHNSGAQFDDDGVALIKEYTWDKTTSASKLISRGKQIADSLREDFAHYEPQVREEFSHALVGTVRYYPSSEGAEDIWHDHESPGWVPRTTVTFHNLPQNIVLSLGDDLNGTIGRGRLTFHKGRYRVTKLFVVDHEELRIDAITTGEVFDLYDFNQNYPGGPAGNAATMQIGYGKGNYGSERNRGKIYLTHIVFDDDYEIRSFTRP